mmetsp:Transcript_64291/g.127146  ORF Transcript_64291/g.127146 Transcript_64291/m.127146 type:complete len:329 (-) Transcript_64291:120-1106(-)
MPEAMVEMGCVDAAFLHTGDPSSNAECEVNDEYTAEDSEPLQEQPLAWRGVPKPSQLRGGGRCQVFEPYSGDSSQKQGRTNSRRSRTFEINSLAEWYSAPCDGPNPVFDEGDAEGHPEAVPLTPASSLPTPASRSGSRSSSADSLSPSSHGTQRHMLTCWSSADSLLPSGRTPNTQDLCLVSPRARKPAASPVRHASRLAGAPALPTLIGSPCGVSLDKLRGRGGSTVGTRIEKFAVGATTAGGLSPSPARWSLTSRSGGGMSLTPRLFTPRVWAPGGNHTQSGSCVAWQEVLSMVGSLICGTPPSQGGGSSKGKASTVAPVTPRPTR